MVQRILSLKNELLSSVHWESARDLLRFARRRLTEERLPQVAGSLTFTTVLALVPLLTIAFAIFTAFPLFNTFRTSLEAYFIQSLMPKSIANNILGYLNTFASKATRLSAVGAAALMATAMAMMLMIDRAFNQIWRVRFSRPFAQRVVVYWAVVTLGPLLIGISVTVTSNLFTATNGMVKGPPALTEMFYTLVSVLFTMSAFTLLYMAIPNRIIEWKDAASGGLLAAAAFEIAKRIFVIVISKFPTYTILYGTLAALPLFLIWVYVSWLLILMGAVFAAALPVVKYERWWHVATPGSAFVDAMAVLQVLYETRLVGRSAAIDTASIRARTRLGFDELDDLLEKMLAMGWVGRIRVEAPYRVQWGKKITEGLDRWALMANPQQLTVADVYRLFVFHPVGDVPIAALVDKAVGQSLDQTLADYFGDPAHESHADVLARSA